VTLRETPEFFRRPKTRRERNAENTAKRTKATCRKTNSIASEAIVISHVISVV